LQSHTILRPSRRLFHDNEIIERSIIDLFIPIGSWDTIFPNLIEGCSRDKGMNVCLHEVLPDQDFLGQQIFQDDIRKVVTEMTEGIH
jgi:hypothetical protein